MVSTTGGLGFVLVSPDFFMLIFFPPSLLAFGFSTGWVAIFMVPFLESFMKRFGRKNRGR